MSFYRERWIAQTRKPHRCGWCERWIDSGSAAEYSAGIFEGDFWANHLHPECAAARDSLSREQLSEGWCPGDYARGRTDDDQEAEPEFSPQYRGKNLCQTEQPLNSGKMT